MWLVTTVMVAAFSANVAAEILAEGVAIAIGQMYSDWFWSLEPTQTMVDVAARYAEVDAMIAAAQAKVFDPPVIAAGPRP
jgi:hypothetical protein